MALVAGFTSATLEVLARVWNPVADLRSEDIAGRWIGVSPAENVVEISIDGKRHRAEVNRRPANLDRNVGRIDGPTDLADIKRTPSSRFEADAFPPDGAPVFNLSPVMPASAWINTSHARATPRPGKSGMLQSVRPLQTADETSELFTTHREGQRA